MIEFYPISNPNSIFSFLNNKDIDLCTYTWIVSDLKSKNEIQKLLIEKQGFFLETSILRASDFWKIALRRLAPHMQAVSSEFIKIVVDNFVDKFGASLDIKPSESSTLAAYVHELAPILLHSESDSVLSEWFTNQTKIKKWQRWHLLSRACMAYILNEHKIIDTKWIAAYLQKLDISQFVWKSDILIDLGTEMSSVEMGLFRTLAQKTNIKIIWPDPFFAKRFSFLLKTYQDNIGYGSVVNISESTEPIISENKFIRVSTQLAEVKFAIAQIRDWHEQGISLANIAIISAQIEKYWPVLKYFLDEEGLIYQKDHVVRLNSLGFIQNFLAYCANLSTDISWDSLETSLYSAKNTIDYKFENFKALFYQIYDDSDLFRDEKIKNLFYKKIDVTKKLSRPEFLSIIVQFWIQTLKMHATQNQDMPTNLFEVIFKDFLARSSDIQANFSKWMHFLKVCINGKEIKTETSEVAGLQILPLMSSHLSSSKYQVWLGLDEKSLSAAKKNLISTADIFELKNKFDFAIEYPEESFYDFNIRWLVNKNTINKIYLCANSSFDAEPLTPSLFFLENNSKHDVIVPNKTRHDDIQMYLQGADLSLPSSLQKIDHYDISKISLPGLIKDFSMEANSVVINQFESLSPSELEEYWKCPFKLLAQKVFRLKDLPQVAVDLDPRQKGSLLHHLFEHLIQVNGANGMNIFLENKRLELKIYPQDDLLWSIQKNKLMQIGNQFSEFEKKRQKIANKSTEQAFEITYDFEQKDFFSSSTNRNNFMLFKGRIDRVDEVNEGYVVYDYKSSTADLKNFSDWVSHGEFQLLIYLLACEKVLYPEKEVIASVYYDYRKFDFAKGYMQKEFHDLYLQPLRKKKSLATSEQKTDLLKEFNELVDTLMTKLQSFDFTAKPEDPKLCTTCNWSKICRAHHLM
ncbi:MAG: PD-(D/E)XK nuclease family protein [Pseudobdellovibrio sp.]